LIWEFLQSDQRQEQSIILENLGPIDALEAGDQHIEERHDYVLWAIIDPTGRGLQDALKAPAQAKLVTKSLNQKQAAEVRQGVAVERKIQCLQAF